MAHVRHSCATRIDALLTPSIFASWILNLVLLTASVTLWVTTGDDPGSWSR